MSSEKWEEAYPQGNTEVRGQHPELASGNNLLSDKQTQQGSQEDCEEHRVSSAHKKRQEVTSEHRALQQDGRKCPERTQERSVPGSERGFESQDGRPGVCPEERCLNGGKQKSFPRGVGLLSYPERERERRVEEPRGPGPFYFFGGANGVSIVTSYCESKGWQRIYDKQREDFKLKWCETKSPVTYYNFREGEQLLYQIPNNKVLTTKIGLLNSLREYDRVSTKVSHGRGLRRLKMEEFFPATFRMDLRDEREAFFSLQEGVCDEDPSMWICKPTGLNQGRGIFLLQSQEDISAFRLKLQNTEETQCNRKIPFRVPQARIVQRYVKNPLLLRGRKFDVRSYFLVACTRPYMFFFRHGYVRLTCELYDPNSNNLSAHLTNQYMQKKNPLYSVLKEETVWSMDRFNSYVNEKFKVAKGLSHDWVLGAFTKRMQQIMTQCFFAVKAKLEQKLGYFDLIGCDFMIDEDFKVWLLEMNCNPALHTNCEVLKEVVPSTVVETLDLTLEIYSKCRDGLRIAPLASQKDFVTLYDGETPPVAGMARQIKTTGFPRAQRSKSAFSHKPPGKPLRAKPAERKNSGRGTKTDSDTKIQDASSGVAEGLPSTDDTSAVAPSQTTNMTSQTTNMAFQTTNMASQAINMPPQTTNMAPQTTDTALQNTNMAPQTTNMASKPHPTPKASDYPKVGSRPLKAALTRVELSLSKCTWQRRSEVPDYPKAPEFRRVKSTITSLSTSALSEGSHLSVRRPRATKACLGSDLGHPLTCSLNPAQFRLAPPGLGQPVWTEGKKGEVSKEVPEGDKQSTTKEE